MDFTRRAFLAPMSSYTNAAFRLLCQRHGAQGTIVPLVSAKALIMRRKPAKELDPHPSERFCGVQLFGNAPEDIGKAAGMVADACGSVRFIDINCACPVRKVARTGAGAALLGKPDAAAAMVEAASSCGLPVTVKLRKSGSEAGMLKLALMLEAAGASALFIHGRTPEQAYSGEADWGVVAAIAQRVSIPVIGSGDVRSASEGKRLAAGAGCSSFAIGRAAMCDPSVFSRKAAKDAEPAVAWKRKSALFLEYRSICEGLDATHFPDLKSKAVQLLSGFPGAAPVRAAICASKNVKELMEAAMAP